MWSIQAEVPPGDRSQCRVVHMDGASMNDPDHVCRIHSKERKQIVMFAHEPLNPLDLPSHPNTHHSQRTNQSLSVSGNTRTLSLFSSTRRHRRCLVSFWTLDFNHVSSSSSLFISDTDRYRDVVFILPPSSHPHVCLSVS